MLPYYVLLSIPVFFCFLPEGLRFSRTIWLLIFSFFVIFIGFRYEVGCDWVSYRLYHQLYYGFHAEDLPKSRESLSHLLFWTSANYWGGYVTTNVIAAFVLVGGIFAFARRTPMPWIAIVAVTPFVFIAFGMSGVRQSLAMGIIYFLLSRWDKNSAIEKFAMTGLAILFHTSSIIAAGLAAMTLRISLLYRGILALILGGILIYLAVNFGFLAESFERYQDTYTGEEAVESSGAIIHLVLVVLPSILGLLFFGPIKNKVMSSSLLFYGAITCLMLIGVSFISTVGASRLSLYMYFVPMLVYPALLKELDDVTGLIGKIIFCGMHFLMLWVWLTYSNSASCYFPYNTLLS